jgi:hypothetical protein
MKPDTALLKDNEDFYFPLHTKDLHHEVELVLKISKAGKHIEEKFAHKYYEEIGIGILWLKSMGMRCIFGVMN